LSLIKSPVLNSHCFVSDFSGAAWQESGLSVAKRQDLKATRELAFAWHFPRFANTVLQYGRKHQSLPNPEESGFPRPRSLAVGTLNRFQISI
jgi:hypothetical protein